MGTAIRTVSAGRGLVVSRWHDLLFQGRHRRGCEGTPKSRRDRSRRTIHPEERTDSGQARRGGCSDTILVARTRMVRNDGRCHNGVAPRLVRRPCTPRGARQGPGIPCVWFRNGDATERVRPVTERIFPIRRARGVYHGPLCGPLCTACHETIRLSDCRCRHLRHRPRTWSPNWFPGFRSGG
jgi:hypothetical protein